MYLKKSFFKEQQIDRPPLHDRQYSNFIIWVKSNEISSAKLRIKMDGEKENNNLFLNKK